MSRPDGAWLVLGIGNVLLRDEGVGVHVTRALSGELDAVGGADAAGDAAGGATSLPAATRIVDGGTLGLDLLPMIEDAAAVVMVDAVDLRAAPGTVAVLRGDALHGALARHVSPHQVGVGDLLAVARLGGTLPERVSLVAIQPEAIEIGLELTPAVAAAVPVAVAIVRDELAAIAAAEAAETVSVAEATEATEAAAAAVAPGGSSFAPSTEAGRVPAGPEPVGAAT